MRTVQRQAGPVCLDQQPPHQDWGAFIGTACHVTLATSLRMEQLGLCCYCESEVAENDGHIEHMEPRSRNQTRIYDYANLAISCNGGAVEHCGHYKDDRKKNPKHAWDAARFSGPHDPATTSLFCYLPNGAITPTTSDPAKANYLIGYLGLDCPRLNERRKQHARDLIDTLGDQPDSALVNWLRQEYLQIAPDGHLRQFHSLSKAILET
ncbi:retron system putative HNH endonuclease [Noviherbaspirillum sp. ST9]|uniref:retron system putative HNH endonuclease n=1 Tax=Noviherbaspirillum sp. ST9 TaxID=3401606 RepID=UPI003B58A865